jgi:hypothetical protein
MIFYIPVIVFAFLVFILGIPIFMFACLFYFIKTGDMECTPDELIPFKLVALIFIWYNNILEKIEEKYENKNLHFS